MRAPRRSFHPDVDPRRRRITRLGSPLTCTIIMDQRLGHSLASLSGQRLRLLIDQLFLVCCLSLFFDCTQDNVPYLKTIYLQR